MNHPVTIRQSDPLASGDQRDTRAPLIAVGEAFFGNQVELAKEEYSTRKRLRLSNTDVVTVDELRRSRCRKVAVETIEAEVTHGFGNAALMAAITGMEHRLNERMDQLDERMVQLDERMVQMENRVSGLVSALFHNQRARNCNGLGQWIMLVVERPGTNPIGVVPQSHPVSREAIARMTAAQITTLENQFNLPAGFFVGATVSDRRHKVDLYFTQG